MTKRTRSHRRAARNARRPRLQDSLYRLPAGIEASLYQQSLEQTADIADPRFRTLFVQRLMLRGHERRLFQLEAKLWAEALRLNNGARRQAVLWIHQNHAEIIRILGRYHAWICARITAVQKALRPYLAQERTRQSASAPAVFAAAAGSSRPILLAAPNEANGRQSARDASPQSAGPAVPPESLRKPACARRPTDFSPNSRMKGFAVTASETLYFVSFQQKPPEIGQFPLTPPVTLESRRHPCRPFLLTRRFSSWQPLPRSPPTRRTRNIPPDPSP